jgi:hypothetical protein
MSFSVGETMNAIGTNIAWTANVAKDFTLEWGGHVVEWGGHTVVAIHEGIAGTVAGQISALWASAAPTVGPYVVPLVATIGAIGLLGFASHTLYCSGQERVTNENAAFKVLNQPQTSTYSALNRIVQLAGLVLAVGTGVVTAGAVMVAAPAAPVWVPYVFFVGATGLSLGT